MYSFLWILVVSLTLSVIDAEMVLAQLRREHTTFFFADGAWWESKERILPVWVGLRYTWQWRAASGCRELVCP